MVFPYPKLFFFSSFWGVLRVSEFACSRKKGDTSRVLSVGDVSFKMYNFSYMVVTIHIQKIDQCEVTIPLVIHHVQRVVNVFI